MAFDTTQITSRENGSNPRPGDPCHPLAAGAHAPAIAFDSRQDPVSDEHLFGALGSSSPQAQAVATLAIRGRDGKPDLEVRYDGTANALLTPNGGRAGIGVGAIHYGMQVRRLTPRECERLQGFPDDCTLIPWKAHQAWAKHKGVDGKPFEEWLIELTGRGLREPTTQECPDGPRYKALGNSWAVPVARWVGQRIQAIESLEVA